MTERSPALSPEAAQRWAAAADQLRARHTRRAEQIADEVFARVAATERRSLPVRAFPPHNHISFASHVLEMVVGHALVAGVVDAVVRDVRVDPARRGERLDQVSVDMEIRFGQSVQTVADQVRQVTLAVLDRVLGAASNPNGATIPIHVHVSDVTVGDPPRINPYGVRETFTPRV